jgi:hypothetical protein
VEEQTEGATAAATAAEEKAAGQAAAGTGGAHSFVVLGSVTVSAPYNAGSCRSTNTMILTQVQRLLERA